MAARKLINVAVQVLRVDVVKRTTHPHLSVTQKVLAVLRKVMASVDSTTATLTCPVARSLVP